jgi:uncharacterized protein (TIRG00374 family)
MHYFYALWKSNHDKLFSTLKYLLLLSVATALLFFAFRGISIGNVFSEMLEANVFWVSISVIFSVAALISRAYRWNLLIESTGYLPPLKRTFYALMIGYFANLAFPRLGEVTRCGSLGKTEGIPFTSLLGTVIVERVVDVISLFACLLLTTIIEYKRLQNFLHDNIVQPIVDKCRQLMGSPIFIVASIVLLALFIFGIIYYLKRSRQTGNQSKFIQLWNDLINGLRSIGKLKRPWAFIFHSVLIWVLYFFAVYTCFFSLPSTAHLGFSASLFLLVAGGLGMSAPVQGGIGAYHLLVSEGLILYGLSQQDGLAFATLIHTIQLVLILVLGSVSLLLMFSKKRNISSATLN